MLRIMNINVIDINWQELIIDMVHIIDVLQIIDVLHRRASDYTQLMAPACTPILDLAGGTTHGWGLFWHGGVGLTVR